jgi:quercetin dioxygenase-like cupin family protein
MSKRKLWWLCAAVAAFALVAGTAVATLSSGFTVTPLARGNFGRIDSHHNGIEVKSRHSGDVAFAQVTFEPHGSSGWHHHPGIVLVSVASGAVTRYDPECRKHVYHAGEGFVEDANEPGLVRNNKDHEAVVYAAFVVPSSTPAEGLRIDDPQPEDCSKK